MTLDTIDTATLRAYHATLYEVLGDAPFTLRTCTQSPELAALHQRLRVACSAFITACNPFSKPLPPDLNATRQAALADALSALGLTPLPAIGRHPDTGWSEPSYLVPGLALADAHALGTRFEQNALLWAGEDALPRLILLR